MYFSDAYPPDCDQHKHQFAFLLDKFGIVDFLKKKTPFIA